MPRGMSRLGSTDSSAASGSCSMARNSHTAKGSVASTPAKPNGKKRAVAFGQFDGLAVRTAPMFSAQRLKSMLGMALIQKTTSTASDDQRDDQRDLERQRHAEDVERQEDGVEDDPPDRIERGIDPEDAAEIGADEEARSPPA